jgi:DNA repair exonuclease SbcCD ATPase subunit
MKLIASAFVAMVALSGCQSAYYAAWEKVGVEKRDILVDRVENAKESQEDAQEQFSSALEAFSAAVAFDGGELEDVYDRLNGQYEDSVAAAEEVSARIDKVESVAEALFDEWQEELEKYQNASLKRDSAAKLRETQRRYKSLMSAMRNAESKMPPVLTALQDNVLYLKHNLNASAIGALQGELSTIENNVAQLIRQMNSAIAESDAFIASMKN